MNGVSKKFPYPCGEHVFRITVIYYNKTDEIIITEDNDIDDSEQQQQQQQQQLQAPGECTLIAVGCSHGIVDGAGLFLLMRAFAAEMRHENYIIPHFDRSTLLISDSELKTFDTNSEIMGKSYEYTTKASPWVNTAVLLSRRWRPKTFIFSKKDITDLKQVALNGSMGDKLKIIHVSTNDVLVSLFWKCKAVLNNSYAFDDPIIVCMVINYRQRLKERFINTDDSINININNNINLESKNDYESKNVDMNDDHDDDDRISIETKNDLNYLGAPLSILLLSKTRRELIDADFSQICYWVRETLSKIRKKDFENDLHFWQ